MARSPAHQFGQNLGKFVENVVLNHILKPRLQEFTESQNYYLDWQRNRTARQGKKVTWKDRHGNKHDLDFVIEIDGTEDEIGKPIAFIEAAWRRYTKHSKNKAQEIQGSVLPIIEYHKLSAPFYGVVLAGKFTQPALQQLENNGFSVIYIPYEAVITAFREIDFDIAFNEETVGKSYTIAVEKLKNLRISEQEKIKEHLIKNSQDQIAQDQIDRFMDRLQAVLKRYIVKISLIPLFGKKYEFEAIDNILIDLEQLDFFNPEGEFERFKVTIDYSNGDIIRATFREKRQLIQFLEQLK
ncbi:MULTISPECIES: hypothetical protein [Spirulina sp. CCY15215]|uniref:hypothetical protein n=1 Tax=Spirulina sp. CCY15215 TaxID=2767591 RepID=UPI0019501486|nr:hypothetical protein [Spirulina major]